MRTSVKNEEAQIVPPIDTWLNKHMTTRLHHPTQIRLPLESIICQKQPATLSHLLKQQFSLACTSRSLKSIAPVSLMETPAAGAAHRPVCWGITGGTWVKVGVSGRFWAGWYEEVIGAADRLTCHTLCRKSVVATRAAHLQQPLWIRHPAEQAQHLLWPEDCTSCIYVHRQYFPAETLASKQHRTLGNFHVAYIRGQLFPPSSGLVYT